MAEAGVSKSASCPTFAIPLAPQLVERGEDHRRIQELLGYQKVTATMITTHVLNRGPLGVCSPADITQHCEQFVHGTLQ